MRKELVKSIEKIQDIDDKTVLLLGDIGVFGFRNSFNKHPNRYGNNWFNTFCTYNSSIFS